jgi:DNA polymerase III epsilon subunit-like protein
MANGLIYYCMDTETTGLSWKNNFHEIVQLSAIRSTDRAQLTRIVRANNWEQASFDALKLTGKTIEDIKKGIHQSELVRDVEEFLAEDKLNTEHRCLVGHNIINFDRKFLWQLWETYNKTFPFSLYLDTMSMTRTLGKKLGCGKEQRYNLTASCELLGTRKYAGAHSAKGDTRNTYMLWEKLMAHPDVNYLEHIKRIPHNANEDD